MCRLNSRLLIALLTFGIGISSVHLWVSGSIYCLSAGTPRQVATDAFIPTEADTPTVESKLLDSKYDHPAFRDGLFYFGEYDGALVLSFNNQPIPPKENDPDAPTKPGFYDAGENLFHFEKVAVSKNKVYFKTYPADGIAYEFKGTAYLDNDPEYYDPIPHIKGSLYTLKNGKVIATRKIEFNHAVIC